GSRRRDTKSVALEKALDRLHHAHAPVMAIDAGVVEDARRRRQPCWHIALTSERGTLRTSIAALLRENVMSRLPSCTIACGYWTVVEPARGITRSDIRVNVRPSGAVER